MKKLAKCLMFVVCFLTLCTACTSANKPTKFEFQRGVNIGNWLSQSNIMDERRNQIFTEQDIELLANNGFDHIRLPVDEVQLFNEDMTLNESTVGLLCRTIDACLKHNLKVIFDLHIIRAHHFLDEHAALWSNPAEQDKLVEMWKVIQNLLRQYPVTDVAYELLNEAVAPTDEEWANLMLRIVKMIRQTEKDRVIVLGANMQNNVAHVKNIKVPEGYQAVEVGIHPGMPKVDREYPADVFDRNILNDWRQKELETLLDKSIEQEFS